MTKETFCILFVCNTTSLSSDQLPPLPVQVTVFIDNNNQMSSKNTTKNENRVTETAKTVSPIVSRSFDYAKSCSLQPYQWFKKNRRYGILGAYLITWVILLSSHYYLNQVHSWSSWQSAISFTELYTRSEKLLKEELIFDIQKRYINQRNPTDFISPLVTFINKINAEEKYLNYYINMLNGINKLYLARLFLINEKKIKEAKARKQRLTFIRQLFLSWAAEYNINQEKTKHA